MTIPSNVGADASREWQPIESAPTDGTAFVGSDGKFAYRTALGRYYVKFPHQEGGPTYQDKWNAEDSHSIWPWNPTLWMPLPTPPAGETK